jgi:predicted O-linked N-acetylglucosamine transferase (SPINDLY family)
MGVPTITLSGDRHASRVGTSIMNMVGLDNLIATEEDEYVAKAAALATNLDELAELRSGMRDRMRGSRLLDAEGFTRTLEGAYRQMWRTWCAST